MTDPRNALDTVVRMKLEAVSGVAEALTDADAIIADEVPVPDGDFRFKNGPRQLARRNLSVFAKRPDRGFESKIPLKLELLGAADLASIFAADNLPVHDVILRAAGLKRTIAEDGSTVTYEPGNVKADLPTATVSVAQDLVERKIVGARVSDLKLVAKTGGVLALEATFEGAGGKPVAIGVMPGASAAESDIVLCEGMAFTFDAFAGNIRDFTWSLGNALAKRDSLNAPDGILPGRYSSRASTISFTLEEPDLADADIMDLVNSATPVAMSWSGGATPGAIVSQSAPAMILTSAKLSYDNGTPMYAVEAMLSSSARNTADEFALVFSR